MFTIHPRSSDGQPVATSLEEQRQLLCCGLAVAVAAGNAAWVGRVKDFSRDAWIDQSS
jgi:hypothetical protein